LSIEIEPGQNQFDLSALKIRTVKNGLIGIASQDDAGEKEVLGFLEAKFKEYTEGGSHSALNRDAVEALLQQIKENKITTSDILEMVRLPKGKAADQESGLKKFFKGLLRR